MDKLTLNKLKNRVKRELFSGYYKDIGRANNTIILVGSGRSGTTWLADSICRMYDYRLIFEPFWHLHLVVDGINDFFHHRFIKADENNYDDKIKYVLSGKYRNFKTNHHYHYGPYDGRVVKDICANLFLKRIKYLFPNIPIIFMIRNPFSVVNSRLRRKEWYKPWGWHAHLFNEQEILRQECDINPEIVPSNELEDHIITYCYENYLPLKWYIDDPSIFKLVTYEKMLADKNQFLKEVHLYIDRHEEFSIRNPVKSLENSFKMSSKQSQKTIQSGKKRQLTKWKNHLDEEEIKTINSVLFEFEFSSLFKKVGLDDYLDF